MSVRGVWASYHQSVGRCRSLRRTNYLQSKETIQNTMRHLPRAPLRFTASHPPRALPSPASHGDASTTAHAESQTPASGTSARHEPFPSPTPGVFPGPTKAPGTVPSRRACRTATPGEAVARGGARKTRHVPTAPRAQVYFPFCSVMRTWMKSSLPGGAKRQNTNRIKSPHLWCPSAHLHVGELVPMEASRGPSTSTGQRGGAGAMSTGATDPHARARQLWGRQHDPHRRDRV